MAAQGGNAQLSVNLISGDDSVTVEERRKMAGVIQDVILISDGKSFSGTTVSRNSRKIIQDAVDRASTGDTLIVAAGLYKENLVLDKSLSIKGSGQGLTVVDGNLAGSVFKIRSSNSNIDVELSGMTI
jgi:nitrous oxidase accessory protein